MSKPLTLELWQFILFGVGICLFCGLVYVAVEWRTLIVQLKGREIEDETKVEDLDRESPDMEKGLNRIETTSDEDAKIRRLEQMLEGLYSESSNARTTAEMNRLEDMLEELYSNSSKAQTTAEVNRLEHMLEDLYSQSSVTRTPVHPVHVHPVTMTSIPANPVPVTRTNASGCKWVCNPVPVTRTPANPVKYLKDSDIKEYNKLSVPFNRRPFSMCFHFSLLLFADNIFIGFH